MAAWTQEGRSLTLTTPLGPDALLLEKFTGREALSECFRFDLELLAEQPVPFERILGQPVLVTIQLPALPPRRISGIVSRFCQAEPVAGTRGTQTFIRYRAAMVPQLWRLTRRVQSRAFQRLTTVQILQQVLRDEWKLNVAFQVGSSRAYAAHNYSVQYRESDFHFVSRLMEEEGIYYYFRHTEDNLHQLVICDESAQSAPLPGVATIAYDATKRVRREGPRVTTWEKQQELSSSKVSLWDYNFALPQNNLAAERALTDEVAVGTVRHRLALAGNRDLEVFDFPGGYAHRFDGMNRAGTDEQADFSALYQDAATTARLRMEEEAARCLRVRGGSDCAALAPGHQFTLANHFEGNGRYVLTAVEHQASLEGAYTGAGEPALVYTNRFDCVPVDLPYRPARATPRPLVHGTETAFVVGVTSNEDGIHCDRYGRVKVQFHWDRQGKEDADSSCWVRVAQSWADKTFGAIQIPRVGQEVIVAFNHGDPDQPVIIGSLYNATNPPPYQLPDNATISGIKTRSPRGKTPEFSGLLFDDRPGHEETMLRAQKDLLLYARDHAVVATGGNLDHYVGGFYMEHHGKFPGTGGGGGGGDGLPEPEILKQQKQTQSELKSFRQKLQAEQQKKGAPLNRGDVQKALNRPMSRAEFEDYLKDEAIVSQKRTELGREPTLAEVSAAQQARQTLADGPDATAANTALQNALDLVKRVDGDAAKQPPGQHLAAAELQSYLDAKKKSLGRPLSRAEMEGALGRPLSPSELAALQKEQKDASDAEDRAVSNFRYYLDPSRQKYEEDLAAVDAVKRKAKAEEAYQASRRLAWKDYANTDDSLTFTYAKPSLKLTASPCSASASIGFSFGASVGGGVKIDVNPFSFLAQGDPKKAIFQNGALTVGGRAVASLLGGTMAIGLGGGGSKINIGPSISYSRGNSFTIKGDFPSDDDMFKLLTNKRRDIAGGILATGVTASLIITQALIGNRDAATNIGLIAMNAVVGAATVGYVAGEVINAKFALDKFDADKDLKKAQKEAKELGLALDTAITAAGAVSQDAEKGLQAIDKPADASTMTTGAKPDSTDSVNFIDKNYVLAAQNVFMSSKTTGKNSCIFINAAGDSTLENGTLLLRGTKEAALLGGKGGVLVGNRGTDGPIVIDAGAAKGSIKLKRGKTRVELTDKEIIVETTEDCPVTIKAKKSITLKSDEEVAIMVGDKNFLSVDKEGVWVGGSKFEVMANKTTVQSDQITYKQ